MNPCATFVYPLLGAALPPRPDLGESLVFQLNGLVVVFLALASIWAVLELTGLYFRRSAAAARPAAAPASPATVPPAGATGVSAETVAVVTAAVHAVVGAHHRIHAIVPAGAAPAAVHEGPRQTSASPQTR